MNETAKHKILIIDDAPANIKILGEVLKSDYKIVFATDGRKGIEMATADNPPDLILLDVVMPGMDGYEVCSRLKADMGTKNIPVIFITGKGEVEDETKGFELGAVDYITKPFSTTITKARVRTHMELKRHRDALESLSFLDGLTKISNRRRFDEYLMMAWNFALRDSSCLSLIMTDIDHFKAYNDNYGHLTGDSCLIQVAQALAASSRRSIDLVARYGGEEFVCVLPKTDLEGALVLAENMRQNVLSLCIPHAYSSAANCLTISQGVAVIVPSADSTHETLIKGADEALYKAKKDGRNKIICSNLSACN
jgi:diguanylate cyclase (GGDEF)-like protein